jgi:ERCC4-type nuclease
MMSVTIDDREHALAALLLNDDNLGPCVTKRRLPLADILISCEEGGDVAFAIERKTVSDLTASLRDGRFAEQRVRLVETYGRERVVYVLEGSEGVWAMPAERGALMALHFRDRVQVLRTLDVAETADAVRKLVALCIEGRAGARVMPPAAAPPPVRRLCTATPKAALAAMLHVLPGMSVAKAQAVAEEAGGMRALCESVHEDRAAAVRKLRETVCAGRRLGPVLAARIADALADICL